MKIVKFLLPLLCTFIACTDDIKDDTTTESIEIEPIIVKEYGYALNDFNVVRDTIRSGDTFGDILDSYGVPNQKILEVASKFRDSFDVRKIVVGKPYVLLNSKDSVNTTQVFIYEKNKVDYAVVDLRDTLNCYTSQKPISYKLKEASGIITSSLSQTMDEKNLSANMTDELAKIYAWTVNFFHLQEGDRFKVVYTERYINDTIPAGLDEIKAAYFQHRGKALYSFNYKIDTLNAFADYYDEHADNLRRAFLKAPVKFSRISSRYNLNRRIKYYGYKLRPHKGTDFAAPIGTPILATADGVVSKSERKGGNGNYVKIRHNGTYDTQYLHMKSRNVSVGQYVKQGDVIGWVGMTGNTGGPHVCYRFWKNGKQVDPFKEDLPLSKPLAKEYQEDYFEFIAPLKEQLDCISY
ncbi:M23 family metallopeptidase [Ulvibacter litoralis]|uniref:Murein DD-endopeptidase MepM and murein hydrolase activator NlpD, contain LysM domain n=1 Tax=Ulvibacter litoralis TaxID=227084 RepID=A0A1G7CZC3_9FLAO|nr:peptidoglycan DD-metalloendopeptidase family protein [Ulvibacter litoralis]GHC45497.1 peptidase M23 [Ulvibacter litoralis]SDE44583.1 Murein DD-endopeptidase MepM and murein hydrolase activator NlpD, contain LysM domain [Ulvibacter litoralis]